MLNINNIYLGDCLEIMKNIDDKSIDMILCDLPYGTTACKWDSIIPFDKLWEQYKRIIKDNKAIVLFGMDFFIKDLKMRKLDLVGQKFGRLTVIEFAGMSKKKESLWKCKCSCKNKTIKIIKIGNLRSGNTKSCGCLKKRKIENLTNKKFGRWTVLEFVGTNKKRQAIWKCQCSCSDKNIKILTASSLRNGTSKSCGCFRKEETSKNNSKDLVGETINGISVTKYSYTKNNRKYYLCKCLCTKDFICAGSDLISGHVKKCKECNLLIEKRSDLVKEWDFEKNKNIDINKITIGSNKKVWWICPKCNNNYQSSLNSRTNMKSGCYNCNISKGNKKIKNLLIKYNITFEDEKRFKDCKDKYSLPFDFYLPDYNLCIEYQGQQHYYKYNGRWKDTNKSFNLRKKHDRIKRKFCKKTKKTLIEISYKDFNNIEKIILEKLNINE